MEIEQQLTLTDIATITNNNLLKISNNVQEIRDILQNNKLKENPEQEKIKGCKIREEKEQYIYSKVIPGMIIAKIITQEFEYDTEINIDEGTSS